ncbi:hypothetical protein HYH02_008238 [Chlamydomonas schloesseri]|uniref:Uncharacterized protein n=1 Tax=Chlamydomonas schloesseri TaxID=2026947 RepID=A0A835WFT7_9CHLO|nr:hypothetical protein HYH02_008238 [Chlamydomonas schloesseri]|eukprot:KAG2446668.1 hypothetical protein HYH02_008238 [Chlamydomonas schloesseri]
MSAICIQTRLPRGLLQRAGCSAQRGSRPVAAGVTRRTYAVQPVAYLHAGETEQRRRYDAEFSMMSKRLGGVVHQAVAAAVCNSTNDSSSARPRQPLGTHDNAHKQPVHMQQHQQQHQGTAAFDAAALSGGAGSPTGLASALLRCLEEQLQAKRFEGGADEAADVLSGFPSASLLHYPGSGLQAVVDDLAEAAADARGAAAPAAVAALRSLAGAVGRVAALPATDVSRDKAAAVVLCLLGMAEALDGATKRAGPVTLAAADGPVTSTLAAGSGGPGGAHVATATSAGQQAQESALLREAQVVFDCIANPTSGTSSRPPVEAGSHTTSPHAPTHPLLSLFETALFSAHTWRPNSAAEIAASLVVVLSRALSPARAGNTVTDGGPVARGAAAGALAALARAQSELVAALRSHGADPASAGRLLAALAEALAAAVITRDACDPGRGPRPVAMFGEAQLLAGLSRMCTGEAMALAAQGPGAAAAAANAAVAAAAAAGGDASADRELAVSDASLVLEVLAEQARHVAAAHREHITQVLQDLRDVPRSLGALSELPAELTRPALHRSPNTSGTGAAAAAAASLRRHTAAGLNTNGLLD